MLTILGFGMVITFMILIMTKRMSPMVALISVPIIFAIVGGFQGDDVGKMMLDGIRTLAPTGVMLMFAILYFAIMIDAGLFDPVVGRILKIVGGDPMKVLMGTAALAAFVSLDGDGSTTYMITVASMLPLYQRLGMSPLNLTCVTMLASGVMNLTPWGGPLARAASALHADPTELFIPMLPSMVAGVVGVILLAYVLGRNERRRLGVVTLAPASIASPAPQVAPPSRIALVSGDEDCGCRQYPLDELTDEEIGTSALLPVDDGSTLARPKLLMFNAVLTLMLMSALVMAIFPMPVLFMVGLAVALMVNYPNVKQQRERIAEHAKNVIAVVSLIFAAGVFTGILSGTGMVDAMSSSFLAVIPDSWGPHLAGITAIASMPFTFFISNDAFYYGVLPIVADAANAYGISDAEMGRASLIGQPVHLLSPLVPSTYLLVGLAGVDFADHQRFTLKWAVAICLLMMCVAVLTGAFSVI